jgi:hypothetical protein
MASDPTTRPIHRAGLPDHPVHGVTPGTKSPGPKATPGAPGDVPDAAEAEPVLHEHLPSRSDDN